MTTQGSCKIPWGYTDNTLFLNALALQLTYYFSFILKLLSFSFQSKFGWL